MSDAVKKFIESRGYGEHLNLSRTIPKLKENATSEERVNHFVKVAGFGFPDNNNHQNKEEVTEDTPLQSGGNDANFSSQSSPVRHISSNI